MKPVAGGCEPEGTRGSTPSSFSCCCRAYTAPLSWLFSYSRASVWPRVVARPVMRSVVLHSVLFCTQGEQPPGRPSQRILRTWRCCELTLCDAIGCCTHLAAVACLAGARRGGQFLLDAVAEVVGALVLGLGMLWSAARRGPRGRRALRRHHMRAGVRQFQRSGGGWKMPYPSGRCRPAGLGEFALLNSGRRSPGRRLAQQEELRPRAVRLARFGGGKRATKIEPCPLRSSRHRARSQDRSRAGSAACSAATVLAERGRENRVPGEREAREGCVFSSRHAPSRPTPLAVGAIAAIAPGPVCCC